MRLGSAAVTLGLLSVLACAAENFAALLVTTRQNGIGRTPAVDGVFREILPTLEERTTVRVLLPATLPDLGQAGSALYAVIERLTAHGYSIVLAFTPDCNGASVCRVATLSGDLDTSKRRPMGEFVTLPGGRKGYYRKAECGANCSDATIRWREGGAVYAVGVKAGAKRDALALAEAVFARHQGR